jgi:hypothetical protein
VLFRSERAGAIDLALDRTNPRVLYASTWEVYRHFWTLSSGGPDSRLYKSVDGGDTWTDLTDNPGLPKGIKGKIGVTVSPARPTACGPSSRPRRLVSTGPTTPAGPGSSCPRTAI